MLYFPSKANFTSNFWRYMHIWMVGCCSNVLCVVQNVSLKQSLIMKASFTRSKISGISFPNTANSSHGVRMCGDVGIHAGRSDDVGPPTPS